MGMAASVFRSACTCCPFVMILFGRNGGVGIGVVCLDVALDAGRKGARGLADEAVKELGVSRVSEAIAAGLHHLAGVEVTIWQGILGVERLERRDRDRGTGARMKPRLLTE